jgi:hypothetical protein
MKNLKNAIYAKFVALDGDGNRNSFYTSVSGQLYYERAKQKATLPYAVYKLITNVPDWTFTTFFEDARIQFDLYSSSNSDEEVEDMYTNLKALYDWCELVISGNTHLWMRRELARPSKDPTDDNWVYNVDYMIKMERN